MVIRVSELRNAGSGSYADLDDRMLVLDFQAGNPEAFDEIHRRYSALSRHVCLRILGNPDDAAEASQETMLRVFQGLGRFNGRYALQPWVARIATNVSLDVTRARARRPQIGDRPLSELDPDEARTVGEDPSDLLERTLEREQVNAVLERLPAHHRDALVLREFEGRSHEEIGEALGVTPSQAKALIHRAKRSFRRAWSPDEGRRGIAALAPILLWPLRLPHALRRLAEPAHEVAAGATASPAAATAAISTGERVTAAAVAVLVAGSAAVGAVALRHRAQSDPAPRPPAAAPVIVPAPPDTAGSMVRVRPDARRDHRRRTRQGHEVAPVVPVSPPSPAESTAPSTDPSPPPPASPTPDPSLTVVPAPAWGGMFQSSVSSDGTCGDCPSQMSLLSSSAQGTVGESLTFAQSIEGPALDAEGDPAWKLDFQYSGSVDGVVEDATGRVDFTFLLGTEAGQYQYSGFATLRSATATDDGGTRLLYEGPYLLDGGPDAGETVPQRGVLYLEVLVWADGSSLYSAVASLQEG